MITGHLRRQTTFKTIMFAKKKEMKTDGRFIHRDLVIFAVIIFLLTSVLTSCRVDIDPAAANSHSAILAVIGEYLYAIIVLMLVVLLWILRPACIALVVLGALGVCDVISVSVSPEMLVGIGVLMFLASFAPIQQYEPTVIISKHFKVTKKEKVKEKHENFQQILIQLLAGIILLFIEYSIFAK